MYFEVREEAEILKNVAEASAAIAFPIIVFPVPGGPNNNSPCLDLNLKIYTSWFAETFEQLRVQQRPQSDLLNLRSNMT
jgi:hypothetical protein